MFLNNVFSNIFGYTTDEQNDVIASEIKNLLNNDPSETVHWQTIKSIVNNNTYLNYVNQRWYLKENVGPLFENTSVKFLQFEPEVVFGCCFSSMNNYQSEIDALASILKHSDITHLKINYMVESGLETVSDYLKESNVTHLSIDNGGYWIGSGITALLKGAMESKVTSLDATACMNLPSAKDLGDLLNHSTLTELTLINDPYYDAGTMSFTKDATDSTITNLTLNNCYLNIQDLADLISQTTIKTLNLTDMGLSEDKFDILCQGLKDASIDSLNLSSDHITDCSIDQLVPVIKQGHITQLNLSDNAFSAYGMKLLVQSLKDSPIQNLELKSNDIHDDGLILLSKALKETSLTSLDLGDNAFTDVGLQILVQSIKDSHVQHLDLSNNNISHCQLKEILPEFNDSSLKSLNLNFNHLTDFSMKALVDVLKDSTLEHIDLRCNNITTEGVRILADGLKGTQIKHIDVDWNISEEAIWELNQSLAGNHTELATENSVTSLPININDVLTSGDAITGVDAPGGSQVNTEAYVGISPIMISHEPLPVMMETNII